VLEPLGLEHSCFFLDEVITHRFVVGHLAGTVARPWALGRQVAPAGGLISNVPTCSPTVGAQWESDLLSPASFAELRPPQASFGGAPDESFGLTWFRVERGPLWFIQHGGGTSGHTTQLVVCPDEQLAFAGGFPEPDSPPRPDPPPARLAFTGATG
jgi:hypothetical protein